MLQAAIPPHPILFFFFYFSISRAPRSTFEGMYLQVAAASRHGVVTPRGLLSARERHFSLWCAKREEGRGRGDGLSMSWKFVPPSRATIVAAAVTYFFIFRAASFENHGFTAADRESIVRVFHPAGCCYRFITSELNCLLVLLAFIEKFIFTLISLNLRKLVISIRF